MKWSYIKERERERETFNILDTKLVLISCKIWKKKEEEKESIHTINKDIFLNQF